MRLSDAIAAAGAQPFAWGVNDCLMLAAAAIDAQMGIDPALAFRGRYQTERGARRMMKRNGWSDVASALDAHLMRCAPSHARRGDIVLVAGCAGVVFGPLALLIGDDGFERVPLSEWQAAWRVGD